MNAARSVWPGEKSERSIVAAKAVMTLERRGLTWSMRTEKERTGDDSLMGSRNANQGSDPSKDAKPQSEGEPSLAGNLLVQGWSNYFHYGHCSTMFGRLQRWERQRLRLWLWKKYKRKLGCYTFFTDDRLYGQYGLWKMPTTAGWTRQPGG